MPSPPRKTCKPKVCQRSTGTSALRCRLGSSATSQSAECERNVITRRCRYIGAKRKYTRKTKRNSIPDRTKKVRKLIEEKYFEPDELSEPRAKQELNKLVEIAMRKQMTDDVILDELENYAKGYGEFNE